MRNSYNTIQNQDTIQPMGKNINTPEVLDGSLNIGRIQMDLNSVRSLNTDTTRLTSKKTIPVVKTIPIVPVNDSINHPVYNVFNSQFDFPKDKSLFDQFYFTPIDPLDYKETLPISIRLNQNYDSLSTQKDNIIAEKIESSKRENYSKGLKSSDWMLGVILFSLILFGWLRFGYRKFVTAAIQSAFSFFAARRIKEEANILRNRVFLFINILFYLNVALFFSQWITFNQISIPFMEDLKLFFAILGVLLMLYFLKGILFKALDFIFLSKGEFIHYFNTVFIYNRMVGLFLLPIIAILPFISKNAMSTMFYIGFFVIGLFYLLRIFRGIQIGIKNKLSIFYLILYLCALEILPIMVVYKLVAS